MNCKNCPAYSKSIFTTLSQDLITKLENEKSILKIVNGNYIFKDNESADYIYCLMDSVCKVTQKKDGTDKETVIRVAGPGDTVGHRSIFHRETYLGNSRALEDGHVCKISKKTIFELIELSPKLALVLLRKLSIDMSLSDNKAHTFHKFNVRERLADILLQLSEEYGTNKQDGKVQLKLRLNRKELASLVPASTENVVRLLSDFKKDGIIKEIPDGELIIDIEALKIIIKK
ncbi:MAG: Crp/Fnr family transcriptional regulator [Rhizobacter sp.]|nr:Crp/Fnr family transcriptional regulator [Bacteriovorax sp.]